MLRIEMMTIFLNLTVFEVNLSFAEAVFFSNLGGASWMRSTWYSSGLCYWKASWPLGATTPVTGRVEDWWKVGCVCVCVFFLLQYSVLTSNNLMIANGHFQHLLLPICQSFSVDLFRIWLAEMKKVCLISLPPAPRSQTQGAPKKLMIFCILSGGGWTNGSIITLDFECSRSFRSGTSYLWCWWSGDSHFPTRPECLAFCAGKTSEDNPKKKGNSVWFEEQTVLYHFLGMFWNPINDGIFLILSTSTGWLACLVSTGWGFVDL